MDPVTIVSITATACGIVDQLGKILVSLVQLSKKFNLVNSKISSLVGYIGCLKAAILQISKIVEGLQERDQYRELVETLGTTLECTKFSISFLDSKLGGLRLDQHGKMGVADKITTVFNSAEFNEYVNGLNSYVHALNLLLNTLQSRSILEQQGILDRPEAQEILEVMEDETSSLLCVADSTSNASQRTTFSETSSTLDTSFLFDTEILNSRIYAVAYRSHLRQALASSRRKDSAPTMTPLKGPAEALLSSGRQEKIEARIALEQQSDGQSLERQILDPLEGPLKLEETTAHDPGDGSNVKESTSDFQAPTLLSESFSWESKQPVLIRTWHAQVRSPSHTWASSHEETRSTARSLLYPLTWFGRQPKSAKLKHLEGTRRKIEISEFSRLVNRNHILSKSNINAYLLGVSESGESTLSKAKKLYDDGPFSMEEQKSVSEVIFSSACQRTRTILKVMEASNIELDPLCDFEHAQVILRQPTFVSTVRPQIHKSIAALAHNGGFLRAMRLWEKLEIPHSVDFFLNSLDRLLAPDYLPGEDRLLYPDEREDGAPKTTFALQRAARRDKVYRVIYNVRRRQWIDCFENVRLVLLTFDLDRYTERQGSQTPNNFQEALNLFQWIVNSGWFDNSEFLLCFTNQVRFAAEVQEPPHDFYSPDSVHGEPQNLDYATDSIIRRFLSLYKQPDKEIHTMVLPGVPSREDWEAIKSLTLKVQEKLVGKQRLRNFVMMPLRALRSTSSLDSRHSSASVSFRQNSMLRGLSG